MNEQFDLNLPSINHLEEIPRRSHNGCKLRSTLPWGNFTRTCKILSWKSSLKHTPDKERFISNEIGVFLQFICLVHLIYSGSWKITPLKFFFLFMNPIGGREKHIHIKFFLQSEKCPMYNYICTGILTSFLVRIQQVTAKNASKQKYKVTS